MDIGGLAYVISGQKDEAMACNKYLYIGNDAIKLDATRAQYQIELFALAVALQHVEGGDVKVYTNNKAICSWINNGFERTDVFYRQICEAVTRQLAKCRIFEAEHIKKDEDDPDNIKANVLATDIMRYEINLEYNRRFTPMTYTVYFTGKGTHEQRERIKERFGIEGITVNGEANVTVNDEEMQRLLDETVDRGFLKYRYK